MAHMSAAAHDHPGGAGPALAGQRPVDLVHLARHTLGNRDLEREVLQIFLRQSALYLERIRAARSGGERQIAAHTIKGSARGIGAWEVAEIAADLEAPTAGKARVAALAAAIERTNLFIAALLDDEG